MPSDAKPRRSGPGYADGPTTKAPPWHGLIAWDMLFNNLTTGLFLVAAIGELARPDVFGRVARWAYPIALVVLTIDLAFLVLDLGDKLRFHHMLRVFKPTSPMSLGTWCLTIYSLPLTLVVAIDLLAPGRASLRWVRATALVLGLLPAFGSAVYKGVLISTSSQPGWKDARWLGGYLANSAVLLGCAGMLVLSVLAGQDRAAALLRPALTLLLVLNLIPLSLLFADLRPALARLDARGRLIREGMISVVGGVLIPLGLSLSRSPSAVLISATFLLAGSLVTRQIIVKIPHSPSGPDSA